MARLHPRAGTPVVAAMLTLTFTTGIVDAVGYLALDQVFAGNMTGNVVILGMGLVGTDGLPVLGPGLALAGFVAGAAAAGRVLRGATEPVWGSRHTALFLAVVVLLAVVAVVLFLTARGETTIDALAAAGMATAMGVQAYAARHLAVRDVTTVVVTSTLTGLAGDSPLGSDRAQPWRRRAGSVVLIATGAAAGAALLQLHPGWGVAAAAGLTLASVVTVMWRRVVPGESDGSSANGSSVGHPDPRQTPRTGV